MDIMAITPESVEQSVDASLHWLTKQHDGHWLLFFDNADDVQVRLKKFFPACASGNILVTTRNQELRHYAARCSDENVTGLDPEDATTLLLHLSQAEVTDENKVLAAQIVQVFIYFLLLEKSVQQHNTGTLLLCFGSLPSRRFYSLPLIITQLSRTLPS